MKLRLPAEGRQLLAVNAAAGGVANIAKIGIQLLLLPVMARLLGPAEFGLYALALPTVAFFTVLADGGLGMSLAREKEAATAVWSTAFWLLLATCSVIALAVTGLGFALAAVVDQPRLPGIMGLLSVSFLLMAVSALPAARLVRRGNLVLHSAGDLVSTMIGAAFGVALAIQGAGAWSLAAQYVAGFLVRAVIFNAAAFERPTLVFRFAEVWPHVMTGGSVIGSRLTEFVGRALENLAYGHSFGTAALGTYALANQISRFLCEAAGNPLWGALYAHVVRADDSRAVEGVHAKLTRLLALILFPAAALLTVSAPQVFALALGPKWLESVGLLQILLPFYALNVVAGQCGAILLADGKGATMFWTLSGLSLARLLAVLAAPWIGVSGVAWGVGAANAAYALAMFAALGRATGAGPGPLLRSLAAPAAASLAAAMAYRELVALQPMGFAWTSLALTTGGATYIAGLLAIERRRLVADAVTIRRVLIRW